MIAFAKRTVAAEIAVFVVESRIVEAQFLLEVQQFARLLFVEILHVTELLREQQDPAVRIENLGLPIGFGEIFAKAHRAVVLQDNRVGRFQKFVLILSAKMHVPVLQFHF